MIVCFHPFPAIIEIREVKVSTYFFKNPKKPTGRPPRLKKEQKAEIRTILEEDNPRKYGQNVWDGPSLSSFIERIYAIKLCVRQCQRLLHSLGFSLVRPQTFPSKGEQNERERTEYKKMQ